MTKTARFIEKASHVHNGFYSYEKTHYIKCLEKVIITCPVHGDFEQTPNNHVNNKQKCPKCCNNLKMTTDTFIEKSIKVHGDYYDYSKVIYTGNKDKVCIICPVHGDFFQKACHHVAGKRCKKCASLSGGVKRRDTVAEFIKKAETVHFSYYTYHKVIISDSTEKVIITCPEHGDFEQLRASHISGQGCPVCVNIARSSGVRIIFETLENRNILFETEKRFDDCRYKKPLPFDFYIPSLNTCIEYDGEQHFRAVGRWGGDDAYKKTKIRDGIKDKFCLDNGLTLIRIRYDENPIDVLLKYGII